MTTGGLTRIRPTPARLLCGAGITAMIVASIPVLAQSPATPPPPPLQVLSDAVLIDARCPQVSVDFGALLRYGQERGIRAIDILPLGAMREAFEAEMAGRATGVPVETLCTAVVAQERTVVPDVIRTP